jgi:plasmid replication initiation protein
MTQEHSKYYTGKKLSDNPELNKILNKMDQGFQETTEDQKEKHKKALKEAKSKKEKVLLQPDFFIEEICDTVKDSRKFMDIAPFSTDRKIRKKDINYIFPDRNITVTDNSKEYGLATIHDYDLIIFAISHYVSALNKFHKEQERGNRASIPSSTIKVNVYDIIKFCNKSKSKTTYKAIEKSIKRIANTQVIETPLSEKTMPSHYNLVSHIRSSEVNENGTTTQIEIGLPAYIIDALKDKKGLKNILTMSPEYFNLSGTIEKAIYRYIRKATGRRTNKPFKISLDKLKYRIGKEDTRLALFRDSVNSIIARNGIPEYKLTLDKKDIVSAIFLPEGEY